MVETLQEATADNLINHKSVPLQGKFVSTSQNCGFTQGCRPAQHPLTCLPKEQWSPASRRHARCAVLTSGKTALASDKKMLCMERGTISVMQFHSVNFYLFIYYNLWIKNQRMNSIGVLDPIQKQIT